MNNKQIYDYLNTPPTLLTIILKRIPIVYRKQSTKTILESSLATKYAAKSGTHLKDILGKFIHIAITTTQSHKLSRHLLQHVLAENQQLVEWLCKESSSELLRRVDWSTQRIRFTIFGTNFCSFPFMVRRAAFDLAGKLISI